MCKRTVLLTICLMFAWGTLAGGQALDEKGSVIMEWWLNIGGNDTANIVADPRYPDNPDGEYYLNGLHFPRSGRPAELTVLNADNYGVRARGYLYPPATGDYTFWISGDNQSDLLLSSDENPANATLICQVPPGQYTGETEFEKFPDQKSAAITLQGGQRYYVEVMFKEGGGGDGFLVAWEGPVVGAGQNTVTGEYVSPFIRASDYQASGPSPEDGVTIDKASATLTWDAGYLAESHDVYFGDDYDEVLAGSGETFRGNQTSKFLLTGITGGILPGGLELGQTYYWRIDEVEADGTKHVGTIWSFSVPAATAQNPQPADGAQFIPLDAQLEWAPGFGALFHTVHFGEDYDTVLNSTSGETTVDTFIDPPMALENGKTYYWRVDETDQQTVVHPGDVWSFTTIPEIQISDPNLVGWWKMDEGAGNLLVDWSGYGHHGSLRGDTQWAAGYDGGALQFDGEGDYTNIDGYKGITAVGGTQPAFTVMAWINTTSNAEIITWGNNAGRERLSFRVDTVIRVEHGSGNIRGTLGPDLRDGQWHHVAAVIYEGGTIDDDGVTMFVDGVNVTPDTSDPDTFNLQPTADVSIGRRATNNDRYFNGLIDDARIYDKAMTQEEVVMVMLRPDPLVAWNPSPAANSEPQFEQVASLSWSAGDNAVQHDVYFGTSQAAVESADTASPEYKGRQAGTSLPAAGLIEFGGGPYYWRVDEINNDSTMTTGRTWEFSIANYVLIDDMEDYNNFSPDTIWEAWLDGFGNASNGSQVGHDLGPTVDAGEFYVERSNVHGGIQSMPYYYNNGSVASEATLTLSGATRDWTQYDVKALTLWYNAFPGSFGSLVQEPMGTYTMTAAGADIWGTADEFHYAYKMLNGPGSITAKIESLTQANTWTKAGVMIRNTLDPNSANAMTLVAFNNNRVRLQYRGDAAGASSGTGDIQNIAIFPRWLKIERTFSGDFVASHADDVGGNPGTWEDLASINISMSPNVYIGLALTSHSVNNVTTAVFSNVSTTGTVTPATFSNQDIGIQSNDPEQMYVKITDGSGNSATVANPDPNAAQVTSWTAWGEFGQGIELSEFTADNPSINLANINTMTIGFGPPAGGSGLMFFDDIRLYPSRCVPELVKPAADFSNNCIVDMPDLEMLADDWLIEGYDVTVEAVSDANLEAQYSFENNLLDGSGNGYGGDPCGVVLYAAGQAGQALDLDGLSFVNVAGYAGVTGMQPRTSSAWIKTTGLGEIVSWGENNVTEKWIFRVQADNGTEGAIRVEINGGYIVGNTDVRDDQWHHVAAVLEEAQTTTLDNVKLYVDGVQEYISALNNNAVNTASTGVVRIGEAPWHDRPFTGQIDELRIYSRAVPQAEIANLAGMSAGTTYSQPLTSFLTTTQDTDIVDDERIDFKDYAVLIDSWLDEQLWP